MLSFTSNLGQCTKLSVPVGNLQLKSNSALVIWIRYRLILKQPRKIKSLLVVEWSLSS